MKLNDLKKGVKVTIWNWLNYAEDAIVQWINWKLYLNNQDIEITQKTLDDFDVKYSKI
jgi:hypothetical protein